MKVGTKFKLECTVDTPDGAIIIDRIGHSRQFNLYFRRSIHVGNTPELLYIADLKPESISDVRPPPEPRKVWNDPSGDWEELRDDEFAQNGDIFVTEDGIRFRYHWSKNDWTSVAHLKKDNHYIAILRKKASG